MKVEEEGGVDLLINNIEVFAAVSILGEYHTYLMSSSSCESL